MQVGVRSLLAASLVAWVASCTLDDHGLGSTPGAAGSPGQATGAAGALAGGAGMPAAPTGGGGTS
ncbi:MAG TPA: hypothetical protein VHL80_19345, partial [Polyangia bacterium]|nr:hypothetical protein [Polyangia bacterium]